MLCVLTAPEVGLTWKVPGAHFSFCSLPGINCGGIVLWWGSRASICHLPKALRLCASPADLLRVILKSTLKSPQKKHTALCVFSCPLILTAFHHFFSYCFPVLIALDSLKCVCASDTQGVKFAGNLRTKSIWRKSLCFIYISSSNRVLYTWFFYHRFIWPLLIHQLPEMARWETFQWLPQKCFSVQI